MGFIIVQIFFDDSSLFDHTWKVKYDILRFLWQDWWLVTRIGQTVREQ